ncbi:2-amino-3-carboxymuconate-6-semialdehyde decarboxylase, partial [Marivirga lumbricoides]
GELEPGKLIEESNISNTLKNKLLGQNALNWLGIHQEKHVTQ